MILLRIQYMLQFPHLQYLERNVSYKVKEKTKCYLLSRILYRLRHAFHSLYDTIQWNKSLGLKFLEKSL